MLANIVFCVLNGEGEDDGRDPRILVPEVPASGGLLAAVDGDEEVNPPNGEETCEAAAANVDEPSPENAVVSVDDKDSVGRSGLLSDVPPNFVGPLDANLSKAPPPELVVADAGFACDKPG